MGCAALRVTDPADLRKALDQGLSSDSPSVVEVRVA
jgi:benzoylformate decarboxylase